MTTPERCCPSQLIHFWVYIDKPEPWISQFSLTGVQPCSFFVSFSIPKLPRSFSWMAKQCLTLSIQFSKQWLVFSTWRRCFVSCSLSAFLNPVDSFPIADLWQGKNSPCLSILWWEQGVFVWAGIVPLTLPGIFVHWPVYENWRELAKIESFCHFLAVPPSPVMCIFVLALILGHVLKWFHFELEIRIFFLGNWNFQVWHREMETRKSPLLEWQSKKIPSKSTLWLCPPRRKILRQFFGSQNLLKVQSGGKVGSDCVRGFLLFFIP